MARGAGGPRFVPLGGKKNIPQLRASPRIRGLSPRSSEQLQNGNFALFREEEVGFTAVVVPGGGGALRAPGAFWLCTLRQGR